MKQKCTEIKCGLEPYGLFCLHDQNKSGFLEGRLLSSQSEKSEKFSKSSD